MNAASPNISPDAVPEPTRQELRIVALHQAIPFVGFGIMDNSLLLLSGEAIDMYLGVKLGISTMCAAALGNIISDLAGVALGTMIEDAVAKWSNRIEQLTNGRIKLPPLPKLTYEQRNLRSVRFSTQMGCAIGLTIGCIIGMFPLLFFPDDHNHGGNDKAAQILQSENERLKAEIALLKGQFESLAKEKQDAIWHKGY
jgi:tRNA-specific adenosine deaminase 1